MTASNDDLHVPWDKMPPPTDTTKSGPPALPWIARQTPPGNGVTTRSLALCFGAGKFVAVGQGGTPVTLRNGQLGMANGAMWSEDGVKWNPISVPIGNWTDVEYGDGLFVAVSSDYRPFGTSYTVMSSTDGIHWTAHPTPLKRKWCSVAYGDGLWIAIAPTVEPDIWQIRDHVRSSVDYHNYYGPPRSMYSFNGRDWFAPDNLDNLGDEGDLGSREGQFVVIDGVFYDTNNPENFPVLEALGYDPNGHPSSTRWASIAYGDGHFFAISSSDRQCALLKRSEFNYPFDHSALIYNGGANWASGNNGPIGCNKIIFNPKIYPGDVLGFPTSGEAVGRFMAVRYGPNSFGNYLDPEHVWATRFGASVFQEVSSPSDDHGWSDLAANPDTGTVVGVQPITAPVPDRRNQYKDIFQELAESLSGGTADPNGAANDDFRAYLSRMVRMERTWPLLRPSHLEADEHGVYRLVEDPGFGGMVSIPNTAPRRGYGLIAYGNGRFVCLESNPPHAVNPDNTPVYLVGAFDIPAVNTTSYVSMDDGVSWSYNIIDGSTDWISVTFGGSEDEHRNDGVFVAVSSHNAPDPIMWSPDGVEWHRSYVTGTDALECQWFTVTYGAGQFVALGSTTEGDPILGGPLPTLMTSSDGKVWSSPRAFTLNNVEPGNQILIFRTLVYGNGRWIAVGHLGGLDSAVLAYGTTIATVATSADLENWQRVTEGVPKFVNWNSIIYGNGEFVAVGQLAQTQEQVWKSTTSQPDIAVPSIPLQSDKVGTVERIDDDTTFGLVMTSPDGLTWTARRASHLAAWQSVAYCQYNIDDDLDAGQRFLMAINNNYLEPIGINALSADILRLIRLLKGVATSEYLAETFPQLFPNVYVIQAVLNIQAELALHAEIFLNLVADAYTDLRLKAADLALSGPENEDIVERLNYVLANLNLGEISDGSGQRVSQLLEGGDVFDDLAAGYITQQAMYSRDNGATWHVMSTLPGNYTDIAWGADYCVAVSDANPYRQTYSNGQIMQSYLGDTWINAMGHQGTQPPPLSRAWKSVTCGRGRFVAVANPQVVQMNQTDFNAYGGTIYRRVLDDLVMTCDPFCQPLEPRRQEVAQISSFTQVYASDQIHINEIARKAVAAQWNVGAQSTIGGGVASTVWNVNDGSEANPSADRFVAVLTDSSDLTYVSGGRGINFRATFGALDNPYNKNIESFRIAVRCSRITGGEPPGFYPTAPDNSTSIIPANRKGFYNRAQKLLVKQEQATLSTQTGGSSGASDFITVNDVTYDLSQQEDRDELAALGYTGLPEAQRNQDTSLLLAELDEYTWDTFRYADKPVYDFSWFDDHDQTPPGPNAQPIPTLIVSVTGLDDLYVYSRGQNLNPDDTITTFNVLQYQRRGGATWTPDEFTSLGATILLSGAPAPATDAARIYSVECLVTYEPDWKFPECDPAHYWRPPITHMTSVGDWNVEPPVKWRLARELRARWDVKQVYLQVQDPCNRWAFRPEDIAPIDKTRFTP